VVSFVAAVVLVLLWLALRALQQLCAEKV